MSCMNVATRKVFLRFVCKCGAHVECVLRCVLPRTVGLEPLRQTSVVDSLLVDHCPTRDLQ